MRTLILGVLIACDAGAPSTRPPTGPIPMVPSSHAAQDLADRFDPAIVGALTPRPVEAGTYGTAIDLSSAVHPSPEVELRSALHGAMTLTFGTGGKASACVAAHIVDDHRVSKSVSVMSGTWMLVDGVAQIAFETIAANARNCDPANADAPMQPRATLRCIATDATATLPADAIVCAEADLVPQLGMPTSRDERSGAGAQRSRGAGLILSRSGIHVEVEQLDATLPAFSFAPAAVKVEPWFYLHSRQY